MTEESVLKGYFKQQGLSKEQMDQAIADFKRQQAANQPDVEGLQSQIAEGQTQLAAAQKAALCEQLDIHRDFASESFKHSLLLYSF